MRVTITVSMLALMTISGHGLATEPASSEPPSGTASRTVLYPVSAEPASRNSATMPEARPERKTETEGERLDGSEKSAGLTHAKPQEVGMDAGRLSKIEDVVADGLRRERMPGCVVLVLRRGQIVFFKAFGQRRLQPEPQPMATDTLFDLASLTKPIATATALMTLVERGQVRLDQPASNYLPEFRIQGKESITVIQLLTHQSGLIPDNPLRDYNAGVETAWENIFQLSPTVEPGSRFIYSDVGFLVLGRLLEKVTGEDLHRYTQRVLFQPLGMMETGYLPSESLRARAAVTQQRDERWMQGEVHDPRAHLLGGVAGHAGLFSTAEDLARYARMMLNQGSWKQVRILQPETVALMTKPVTVSAGTRGLGWDIRSPYSTNRGDLFSDRAYGHGGFTGTAIWLDPALDLGVIFLSNRVHPDGKGLVNDLAGRIGTIAAAAINETTVAEK